MEDEVSRCAVCGLKLHSQRAQTAVTGQAKRRVIVEHLPVEVDADVCPHVFGTNWENLGEIVEISEQVIIMYLVVNIKAAKSFYGGISVW